MPSLAGEGSPPGSPPRADEIGTGAPSFLQQQLLSSIRSTENDPSARSRSEALVRQNRELVAALQAQQTLMLQQASEMRRLREHLARLEPQAPQDFVANLSPFAELNVADANLEQLPHGLLDSGLDADGGRSKGEHQWPIETGSLPYSVPFQQGFLYAALDTLTTNSCTATTDSFAPLLGSQSDARAVTAHIRAASHTLHVPPPSLPVNG